MTDKYRNFAELANHEPRDKSWRIVALDRRHSNVLVIAPHGGGIERGTSELAIAIAAEDYSLYCFEGLKRRGNRDLHITSHHFDEPTALEFARRSAIVLGIHGCSGHASINIGGLDAGLAALVTNALLNTDLPARQDGHGFPAKHPLNICNRSSRNCGVQLEITRDLRSTKALSRIALAVRIAVQAHLAITQRER